MLAKRGPVGQRKRAEKFFSLGKFGTLSTKGISTVIGFLLVIVILFAVLVPAAFYVLELPNQQQQSIVQASPYMDLAQRQMSEFQVSQAGGTLGVPPVVFLYGGGNVAYFVFPTERNPPVPVTIRGLLFQEGNSQWVARSITPLNLTISNANSTFEGFRAIEVPVPQGVIQVAAVTNLGRIIYAVPPYSIPLPKLRQPLGIIEVDPTNFAVLSQAQEKFVQLNSPESLTQFLSAYGGTASLTGFNLVSGNNLGSISFSGVGWDGPLQPYTELNGLIQSAEGAIFQGSLSGQFSGASLELIGGNFNGLLYGISSIFGKSPFLSLSGVTFDGMIGTAQFSGSIQVNIFQGNIEIPSLSNSLSTSVPTILLKGGEIDVNVTCLSLSYSGSMGPRINGFIITPSGVVTKYNGTLGSLGSVVLLNGSVEGSIGTGTLTISQVSNTGLFLTNFLAGNMTGSIDDSLATFQPQSNAIIIDGTLNGSIEQSTITLPNPSSFLTPGYFNISGEFNVENGGNMTIEGLSGNGTLSTLSSEGQIVFPTMGILPNLAGVSGGFGDFSGYINGQFYPMSGGGNLVIPTGQGSLGGLVSGTYTVISLGKTGSTDAYIEGGSLASGGYVITPIIVKFNLLVANPSNETVYFNYTTVVLRSYVTFALVNNGGNTPTSGTNENGEIFGDVYLHKDIMVSPLNVTNITYIVPVPVTSFNFQTYVNGAGGQSAPPTSIFIENTLYTDLQVGLISSQGYEASTSVMIPSSPIYEQY